MDDLKAFAKNKEEILRCKELVKRFNNDIKIDFGLDKCAVLYIEKGSVVDSPLLEDIPSLRIEDAYKYSGISEASEILHTKVKSKATKEFI